MKLKPSWPGLLLGKDLEVHAEPGLQFPENIKPALDTHLGRVKLIQEKDLADDYGEVYLPHAVGMKYPNAARE
ncbi:MAG: hypothetical protein JRJ29_15735 [Deltaproteobacteria bacterium]|nr:hypothetical protein [Deltaproteobacteria bacterium]